MSGLHYFLDVGQTKQTKEWVWAIEKKLMTGFGPDRTDGLLGMGQAKQTKGWVLVKPNIFNSLMSLREQIDNWVCARPNRSHSGMRQTEHIQLRYRPDGTDPIQVWARRRSARPTICPD